MTTTTTTRIETLERRVLMDGDVTVTFVNGDLSVRGDDGDNVVQITSPAAGTIRVEGRDDTTINGEAFAEFSGPLDDVRINTRQGGEDAVDIQGPITIGGDVNARLGDGEFAIEGTLGPVEIDGDLLARPAVTTGVAIRNEVTVHGEAHIQAGQASSIAATPALLPDFAAATFGDSLNIDNPYFPLVPGTTYVYEERSENEETGETDVETVTTDVTNDTRTILGVQVRVVHDVERLNGVVVEDTFDWYAQDDNGNVWYFGEDTTSFEYDDEGNVIEEDASGSFEAGQDGARAGVVMLANPQVGNAYFQEVFVGEAIDVGEVLATNETLITDPLGTSTNVLRTRDVTALEADALEHKLYAPGFGLVQEIKFDVVTAEEDAVVRLISATKDGQPVTQVVPPDNFSGVNPTGVTTGGVEFRDEMSITSPGTLGVVGASFVDDALFYARDDIVLRDCEFNDEVIVLATRVPGSVGIHGVSASDDVRVQAREDVFITDSDFNHLSVNMTSLDNELVIEGSSIENLFADGARGEDTFDDAGDNDFGHLRLRDFEEN